MKISITLTLIAAVIALAPIGSGHAQGTKSKSPPPAAQTAAPLAAPQADGANAPASPGWIARCNSASRDAPLECAIEQSAVLTKTGQLIVLVNIRVASDTHTPVALVQLPLG